MSQEQPSSGIGRLLFDLALMMALGPVFGKIGGAAARVAGPHLAKLAGIAPVAKAAEVATRLGATKLPSVAGSADTLAGAARWAGSGLGQLASHTVLPMAAVTGLHAYTDGLNESPTQQAGIAVMNQRVAARRAMEQMLGGVDYADIVARGDGGLI